MRRSAQAHLHRRFDDRGIDDRALGTRAYAGFHHGERSQVVAPAALERTVVDEMVEEGGEDAAGVGDPGLVGLERDRRQRGSARRA
jgi:hypothetical protein